MTPSAAAADDTPAPHATWRWWRGGRLATLAAPDAGLAAEFAWDPCPNGDLLTCDERIVWLGPQDQADAALRQWLPAGQPLQSIDLDGALVTPGLIDAHTHLVYAGQRAAEFELRLQGASYEQIARAGGGIRSTVAATRAADDEQLFQAAAARAHALQAEGVTCVEIKSGYGLSDADEARCLGVARRIGRELPLTVRTTALAAHALPPEYEGRADDYIQAICDWLPGWQAQGLVDAVDAFCEHIAFTPAQVTRVFGAARALGLPVKLHAEQLSDSGGAALAARHGALSCDHLEHLSDEGIAAMQRAGTVAMLLPGAYYFLRDTQLPPVDRLRAAGVPIALATDHNPGSSPTLSLPLMLNMACTLFRLTPREALEGVTRHAARALGLQASHGQLRPGHVADFALWRAAHPNELAYRFGHRLCRGVVRSGRTVFFH